ncbi:hypothetical protein Tco_1402816 [Tanacetum coccineum]
MTYLCLFTLNELHNYSLLNRSHLHFFLNRAEENYELKCDFFSGYIDGLAEAVEQGLLKAIRAVYVGNLVAFRHFRDAFSVVFGLSITRGPKHPIVTIPLLPDFGGVTDGTRAKNPSSLSDIHARVFPDPYLLFRLIMPPRRFKKKSVRKIVEKRVAKAIEKYEKTRADSNNTGGSGSTNTGGTVVPEMHGCSYKTFMNGKPHSFKGTEGVVGLFVPNHHVLESLSNWTLPSR